jgi:acyl carrier protein
MLAYEELVEQLIKMVKAYVPEGLNIGEDTNLISDLEFDSLKVMNLMEEIEDYFDISIPLNVLSEIRTVKDFALQLERIVAKDQS